MKMILYIQDESSFEKQRNAVFDKMEEAFDVACSNEGIAHYEIDYENEPKKG